MTERTTKLRFIDRELRRIELSQGDVILKYPLNAVPDLLWDKLISFTEGIGIDNLDDLYSNNVNKPFIVTHNLRAPFHFNCAPKLIRPTLTDEAIAEQIDEIESIILSMQGIPFEKTVKDRLDFYRDLFLDESKLNRFRLGSVELYGENTYYNIREDPRVSLGVYWYDPKDKTYYAFQLNAIVEIVPPGTPFYRFMRILRQLFATKYIDLHRPEYICAYKFWISEAKPKHLVSHTGFIPMDEEESENQ